MLISKYAPLLGIFNNQPATVGCWDAQHQKAETLSATGWTALPDFPLWVSNYFSIFKPFQENCGEQPCRIGQWSDDAARRIRLWKFQLPNWNLATERRRMEKNRRIFKGLKHNLKKSYSCISAGAFRICYLRQQIRLLLRIPKFGDSSTWPGRKRKPRSCRRSRKPARRILCSCALPNRLWLVIIVCNHWLLYLNFCVFLLVSFWTSGF